MSLCLRGITEFNRVVLDSKEVIDSNNDAIMKLSRSYIFPVKYTLVLVTPQFYYSSLLLLS